MQCTIDQIKLEQRGPDSVYVSNIGFDKPLATTKVGITAKSGFQAEVHYFVTGLDAVEKIKLLERQLRDYLDTDKLSLLKFTTSGGSSPNPNSQDEATLDVRIFAQAPTEEALSPKNFLRRCWNIVMMTYPGATFAVDARQGVPKPYLEYFVTTLPLSHVNHVTHLPSLNKSVPISPPTDTVPYVFEQEIEEPTDVKPIHEFGPFTTAPLGYIVHSRSGDKGSDCNVGFYVRHADEYPWLRSLLSVERMKELLQNDYNGKRIERFELPNIHGNKLPLRNY